MSMRIIDTLLWNSGEQLWDAENHTPVAAGLAVLEDRSFDIGAFPEMAHPQDAAIAEAYYADRFPEHDVRIQSNGDNRSDERATGLIVLRSLLQDPTEGIETRTYAGRNTLQATLLGGVTLRVFHAFDQSDGARPAMFAELVDASAGSSGELWLSDDNFTDPVHGLRGLIIRGMGVVARPIAPKQLTREMAERKGLGYRLSQVERLGAMVGDAYIAGNLADAELRDVGLLAAARQGVAPTPTVGSGVLASRLDRIRIKGPHLQLDGSVEVTAHPDISHAHADVRTTLTLFA